MFKRKLLFYISVFTLLFLRVCIGEFSLHKNINSIFELGQVNLCGVVNGARIDGEKNISFRVKPDDKNWQGLILIRTKENHKYMPDDRICVSGLLERPQSFETDSGKSFNYPFYLGKDSVYSIINNARVIFYQEFQDLSLKNFLAKIRFWLYGQISETVREPGAHLVRGVLLGDTSGFVKSEIDKYRASGLSHIIVLSGFNMTIIGIAFMYIFIFFPIRPRLILSIFAIMLFALMSGGGATGIRAALMSVFVIVARLQNRGVNQLGLLIFVASLMIFVKPVILLHDPSFQLSFLATLGLIVWSPFFLNLFKKIPNVFGMRDIISSTVAVQLFLFPFMFYLFGQFSIIGFVSNIFVVPIIPLFMLISALATLFHIFTPYLGDVLGLISGFISDYIYFSAKSFSRIEFAVIYSNYFSLVSVALSYIFYFLIGYLLTSSRRFSIIAQFILSRKSSTYFALPEGK